MPPIPKKVLIFGNSGSGKSTLAHKLAGLHDLAHFDLDKTAWLPTDPPERRPLEQSAKTMTDFMQDNPGWLFEGCYEDLLEIAVNDATDMIFLDLPVEACISNAKARPWEPHKYPSKKAQDDNLDMLIDWISQYETREDGFSRRAHQAFFNSFTGHKIRPTENTDDKALNHLLPTLTR